LQTAIKVTKDKKKRDEGRITQFNYKQKSERDRTLENGKIVDLQVFWLKETL